MPEFLTFASDADILALWGAGFLLAAFLALYAEKRRNRRDPFERIRRVGWIPWTSIFIGCMIIGGGMLALALPRVIAG
ncbi:hypothetical protein P7228_02060 [Altererythrobacter arenosus]|uniref:Uncharacterized protein n=1 Tax=Altererythrobacter arenosus TaxID=3032592 RepID=A0ABY8FS81_9SPHN|nr:hypothetical protein [Altererythrobacter sp. CAU 1644]WFL77876.1 hypothetical protein P7228_02060 [Altererythrobacter sp. CAU 1644]